MKSKLICKLALFISIQLSVYSCSSTEDYLPSAEKDILGFEIENVETRIEGNTIYLNFSPQQTDFNLSPVISISDKAEVFPLSGTQINFKDENIVFTVTAEDGTKKMYAVETSQKEGLRSVTLCFFNKATSTFLCESEGAIDEVSKIITFKAPKSLYANSQCIVYVRTSTVGGDKYTVIPNSDELLDENWNEFSLINNETVTSIKYDVKILNTDINIERLNFPIKGYGIKYNVASVSYAKYTEGLADTDYVVFTFEGEDITSVVPTMTYSAGATISPAIDQPLNFTNDVKFTVTSESGDNSKSYTIRIVKKKLLISNDHYNRSFGIILNNQSSFYYDAISPIVGGSLFHIETGEEIKIINAVNSPAKQGGYSIVLTYDKVAVLKEKYRFRAILENGDIVDADILFQRPF